MKIFIDTGSIKDIETIAALGILDGVTTNPSLLAKEPGDFRQNLKRICDIVKGPGSVALIARSVFARRNSTSRFSTGRVRRIGPTTRGTGLG